MVKCHKYFLFFKDGVFAEKEFVQLSEVEAELLYLG